TPSGARASIHVRFSAERAVLSPRWCTTRSAPLRRYMSVADATRFVPPQGLGVRRAFSPQFANAGGAARAARIVEREGGQESLPGGQIVVARRGLDPRPD